MTMTAGSASVSRDSPPAFNNIMTAAPCSCTASARSFSHLTASSLDRADWLPVVSASQRREAAHRAFPKKAEDWDIERIKRDFIDAAERVHEAGFDGLEVEAYGHLLDQF